MRLASVAGTGEPAERMAPRGRWASYSRSPPPSRDDADNGAHQHRVSFCIIWSLCIPLIVIYIIDPSGPMIDPSGNRVPVSCTRPMQPGTKSFSRGS